MCNNYSTKLSTPAKVSPLPKDADGDPPSGHFNYSSVIDMLLYLCCHSRPDIAFAFAVHHCARYTFRPTHRHEKLGCKFWFWLRFLKPQNRTGTCNFTGIGRSSEILPVRFWCFLHCQIYGRFCVTSMKRGIKSIRTCSNQFGMVEIGLDNTLRPFAGICAIFRSFLDRLLVKVRNTRNTGIPKTARNQISVDLTVIVTNFGIPTGI